MDTASRKIDMNIRKKIDDIKNKPAKILVYGFFTIIIIGAILLSMPFSSASGEFTPFVDALFTSTSAVCVTGLAVVTTSEYWSTIGHIIIIILIQIGGLGIMTIATVGTIFAGRRITLKGRIAMKDSLNVDSISGVVKLTKSIFLMTVFIEALGAISLSFRFVKDYGRLKGIWYSIFHSISAFCNAGFDIIGDSSLAPYKLDFHINMTVMMLIIFGGIGFSVISNVFSIKRVKYTLHTRFVLLLTVVLILSGFLFYFVVEFNNPDTIGNLSLFDKIQVSMFESVTTRTAGFSTIDQSKLTPSSQIITNILMFIGGSPGGTAGGVKTTTIGIILLSVISIIKGSKDINIFKYRISKNLVSKAVTIFFIGLTVVTIVVITLSITEVGKAMTDIIFEVFSAFATVGLSTGITSSLSVVGKLVISVTMFFGRVGPLTIIIALAARAESKNLIRYSKGKIGIG